MVQYFKQKIVNCLFLFVVVLLVFCNKAAQKKATDSSDLLKRYNTLTVQEIDTLNVKRTTIDGYHVVTDYATKLFSDSVNSDSTLKGDVLLSILSSHLSTEIENKNLDPGDEQVKSLIKKYEKLKFIIYQPRVSNFLKAARHACNGNFRYIYSRLKVNKYFVPLVIVLVVFLLFSLISLFGLKNWKYRKRYNVFFWLLLGCLVVIAIVFFRTCHKYVTQDSFYGIHL